MMQNTLFQFFQFSLIGLISFGIDVAALWLLADWLPLVLARVIAFGLAVFSNWVCHRLYTFRAHASHAAKLREASQFLVASLIGMVPNIGVYWWLIETQFYAHYAHFSVAPVAAMMPGILIGHFVNFGLSKYWVFNQLEKNKLLR